jgi:hypothetical protein
MAALAVFAFLWAVARAALQSVTGDEADTYTAFVARQTDLHWYPAANNHILNSLLIRVTTAIFGVSHLSLRAPALLGAALYIAAAFVLCRLIATRARVRLPLFVCLVFNPLVFDHFVAARGYGFALALWLWAVTAQAWAYSGSERERIMAATGVSSALLALSFTANFSFAFFCAATWIAFLILALTTFGRSGRLLLTSAWPGLLVIAALPSWTLLQWPAGQFFFGATSLKATFKSLADASTYELNPLFVNPLLLETLRPLAPYLIPALLLAALAHGIALAVGRAGRGPLARFGLALGGALVLALGVHRLAYRFFHLLLPLERTAVYIIPAVLLIAGVLLSLAGGSRWTRRALLGMLCAVAAWNLASLRLNYFYEWRYQQDIKSAWHVVAWYHRNRGVRDVEVSWQYHGAMNFYREMARLEDLPPFPSARPHATDRQMYVVDLHSEQAFVDAQHLAIVWRGETTDMAIGLRP